MVRPLESLREAWDTLAAGFRSPLLEHDWFMSCAETLHVDSDINVVTTWQADKLTGAAPLVSEGGRLAIIGGSRLYEPADWLYSSDEVVSELTDRVLALRQPMILQRIPAESPVARAFDRLSPWRAVAVVRTSADVLAVDTRSSWNAYYEGLSSRITSNLRRLRRKAEKALGRMTVAQSIPGPAEVDAHLETVVAIEGSGWKGRRGSSLGSSADLREFFRRYGRRASEKGRLRVSTLSFGTHVAAVELSVVAYRRLWQLKIGYQESLAAYYPGLQLTEVSIRSAFEQGLESYEFLGSAAEWERRWRPEVRQYRAIAVYPMTGRGLAGACRDVAGALWRRRLGHRRIDPA